jgi:hypothetical protein
MPIRSLVKPNAMIIDGTMDTYEKVSIPELSQHQKYVANYLTFAWRKREFLIVFGMLFVCFVRDCLKYYIVNRPVYDMICVD